jgi:hypothetical protein
MSLGDARRSTDYAKCANSERGVSWRSIARVFKSRPLRQLSS